MEIILGRTNTGKSEYILNKIKESVQNNKKSVLIVPEQYTLHAEQELIKRTNGVGIMDIQVLSFRRMSEYLRGTVRGKNRNLIDDTGMYILASRATEENYKDFQVFKNSYDKRGFLENVVNMVDTFKKNCISSDQLSEYLEKSEDSVLKRKLHDMNLVYKSMSAYMDNGFLDNNDSMTLLKENIMESDFFEDKNVFIDSFDTFSNIEYEVLAEIIKKAGDMTISITTDDNRNMRDYSVFEPTEETFQRIYDIGVVNGRNVNIRRMETQYIPDKYLSHLEKNLFAYPGTKMSGKPESISVFSYLNRNEEIEGVAIEIMKLAIEKNIRWNEILVVSNNMEVYQSYIKRVFSEYNVPYFLDETRDISSHSLMVFVLNIFKSISSNFRYAEVYKMLKSGFSWLDDDQVEALENYSLQYKVQGNKYFQEFEKGLEEYSGIEDTRAAFAEKMQSIKEFVKSKKTIKEINEFLFHFLQELGIKGKIDDLITEQRENEKFDIANETAQVWNILIDIMNQMTEIMGNLEVDATDFCKLFESGLSNYKVGVIPSTLDQVIFGSLDRTRSSDIKYLFVIGVNDGILPSNIEDTGILLDEDRELLKDNGLDMKISTDRVIKKQNFDIYSSFTKPSEKLILSFSNTNSDGGSLRPSVIIDRIRYIFPDISIEGNIDLDSERRIEKVVSKDPSKKLLTETFREYINGEEVTDEWFNVYSWYMKEEDWEKTENIMCGIFETNQQEYIAEGYARRLYGNPIRSSVSRIEKFNACPFSHFMTYGLNPIERKRGIIDYPDIGTILHGALEVYGQEVENLGKNWTDISKAESDNIVDRIIDNMTKDFHSGIFNSSYRYKYLVNKLKRVSKKSVYNATEHLRVGEFKPEKYEFAFGSEFEAPPIVFEFEDGTKIELRGKVDRVDLYSDGEKSYAKIIDYKSGYQDFRLEKALQGLQIQLVVYMDAVLQNSSYFVKNELYPAGAFYFKLKDPIAGVETANPKELEITLARELKLSGFLVKDIDVVKMLETNLDAQSSVYPVRINKDGTVGKSGDVYELEDIDLIIDYIKKIIKESAKEIIKGNVKAEPYNDNNMTPCAYCEYDSICRFDVSMDGNEYKKLEKKSLSAIKKELELQDEE